MNASGWTCEVHPALPSTSDEAIERAERGAPGRLVILARRQTRGRGSRGRRWEEPAEGNLALSVLLRPEIAPAETGRVAFASALALVEALDPFAGTAQLGLKWPNDVLAGDAKLGGVLVESAADRDRMRWLVIGFGANLALRPELAPGSRPVACLAEGGVAVEAETVAGGVLRRLDHWMERPFDAVRAAWLARAHPPGTTLEVDGRPCRFVGLADDGALLAEDEAGTKRVSTVAVFDRVSAETGA